MEMAVVHGVHTLNSTSHYKQAVNKPHIYACNLSDVLCIWLEYSIYAQYVQLHDSLLTCMARDEEEYLTCMCSYNTVLYVLCILLTLDVYVHTVQSYIYCVCNIMHFKYINVYKYKRVHKQIDSHA